jgi:ABC-2 type transport system permease protein
MKITLLLLSPKIKSIKNSINLNTLMRRLPFILIGIVFWVVFYIGSHKILSFIRSIEFIGEILSKKLLSMTFFSLGIFLLISNIITALSSFYMSKDIPFLMSKPVEIKEILRLKSMETILTSSWMVIFFIPPFFIAYGINYNAPIFFYIFLTLTFIPFILISGGIGILIAHLLTRVFPVRKIRLALLAIGLFLFLLIYLFVKSQLPVDLESPERFIHSFFAAKIDLPVMPNFWMTEIAMASLKKQMPDVLYLLLLLSNSLFMLMLSDAVGQRLYINNVDRIQPSARDASRLTPYRNFYPGRNLAVLWKDTKIFFRDTSQWSQVFIIGALIFIYIYNFRTIPLNLLSEFTPFIKEIMVLINMVMAGLVLSAVSARFLYSSLSLEGMAFWILKISPLTVKKLIWSKFFHGFIPVTVIMSAIVFITNMIIGADTLLMIFSLVTVVILCISISGLGVGMGSIYPRFRYENIASVSMSPTGMLFMLIAFSVVLLTLSIEAWSFYSYKMVGTSGLSLNLMEKTLLTLACLFITVLNILTIYIPMKKGEKRLSGDISI